MTRPYRAILTKYPGQIIVLNQQGITDIVYTDEQVYPITGVMDDGRVVAVLVNKSNQLQVCIFRKDEYSEWTTTYLPLEDEKIKDSRIYVNRGRDGPIVAVAFPRGLHYRVYFFGTDTENQWGHIKTIN